MRALSFGCMLDRGSVEDLEGENTKVDLMLDHQMCDMLSYCICVCMKVILAYSNYLIV